MGWVGLEPTTELTNRFTVYRFNHSAITPTHTHTKLSTRKYSG